MQKRWDTDDSGKHTIDMDELNSIEDKAIGEHEFSIYEWDSSEGWRDEIVKRVGSKVREIYAGYEEIQEMVDNEGQDTGFDLSGISDCIDDFLKTTVPDDDDGGIVSTPRSDFPELIASICLESIHGTNIPLDLIEKRDTLDQPGRGIDIIGYEEPADGIQLILTEVKGSAEKRNPPRVVTGKSDSMDKQLKEVVLNQDKLIRDLQSLFRKANSQEDKGKLLEIMMEIMGSSEFKRVILCPFLVRELDCYDSKDYEPFVHNVDNYEPFSIRFLAVCIDDDIGELSKDIYEYAAKKVDNGSS